MPNITKKKFEDVCNKYPPNWWIRSAFKYFSDNTEKENMVVKNSIVYTLVFFFVIGFFGTIFNASHKLILISSLIYAILLAIVVIYLFIAYLLNLFRIRRIIKELGITAKEYDRLVEKFYK